MTALRPLSETLAEFGNDLQDFLVSSPVTTKSVELSLPLDIRYSNSSDQFVGDVPLFRHRTWFDPQPARIHIVLGRRPT